MGSTEKRLKTVIVVLTVLLVLSLAALSVMLARGYLTESSPALASAGDNIITPEGNEALLINGEPEVSAMKSGSDGTGLVFGLEKDEKSVPGIRNTSAGNAELSSEGSTSISLYKRHPDYNEAFSVGNMFPGDVITKNYCVRVSYRDYVTVKFHATVRDGYEKLAEVLMCRVVLTDSGRVLYDGLMRDMPAEVSTGLSAEGNDIGTLNYEITAYLETSVGNEYQNLDLIADFRWWIEETNNLREVSPNTGSDFDAAAWLIAAAGSLVVVLLLSGKRRKGVQK